MSDIFQRYFPACDEIAYTKKFVSCRLEITVIQGVRIPAYHLLLIYAITRKVIFMTFSGT